MLTLQRPLIRTIIQDGIEELRAMLIFNSAFPDGILAMSFMRHTLNVAAEKHCPMALSVRRRLIHDEDYTLKISPVVSSPSGVEDHKTDVYSKLRARIPLFRSEVKDFCNAIILAEFVSMASADIIDAVELQLSNYHYTYPTMRKVSNACSVVMVI